MELDDQLSSDFDRNNINFCLFFIYNNKKYTQWQNLSALINNHNGSLIMPKFDSFLEEKEFVLRWIAYNTPTYEDVTITPLVGTKFSFMFVDIDDKSPVSLYQQWVLSLYYLIWEYNILLDVYLILQSSGVHLYKGIEDITNENYAYWFNRQLKIQPLEDSLKNESFFLWIFIQTNWLLKEKFLRILLMLV